MYSESSDDNNNDEIMIIPTKTKSISDKKLHELSVKGLLEFIQEKAVNNVGYSENGLRKFFNNLWENHKISLGNKRQLIMDKCKEMLNKCYFNYGKKCLKQYLDKNNKKLNSRLFGLIRDLMWDYHEAKYKTNYADYEDEIMEIINANIEVVKVETVEEIEADESDMALLDDSDTD
jgi:hypothetical protein